MISRRTVLLGSVLAVSIGVLSGCSARQHTSGTSKAENQGAMWSRGDALRVLEYAAESEDAGLRSVALVALSAGEGGSSWLIRGWHDPSVAVQRAIAKAHPRLLSVDHLVRPGADPLAVAWVLQEYPENDPLRSNVVGDQQGLIPQMLGQGNQVGNLLSDVKDGMIPPEPMFIELLVRSGIDGVGEAMAVGASRAEDEMRLPLSVASFEVAPDVGLPALDDFLSDADEMTRVFAVEAITSVGGERATTWLRRVVREDGPVREHAKIGLVALGVRPLDDALAGLSSPDRDVRAWAATCLGIVSRNRPLPRDVILTLQGTWRDESVLVRRAVTHALLRARGATSVPFAFSPPNAEVDTVAVLVAASWLRYHDSQVETSPP